MLACAVKITLYDWRPDNNAYDGLPVDEADAQQRCRERFVVEHLDYAQLTNAKPAPDCMLSEYSVDLRYVLNMGEGTS